MDYNEKEIKNSHQSFDYKWLKISNQQWSPSFKYKLLCPRGTQTCALAVANIAHAVREMLDVAKRPIPQG